jgi:3-mercaptopyruvate sulfurtransferase SseA
LHKQYGFDYKNLKVLLGGWNAWKQAGYPSITATPDLNAPTPNTNAIPLVPGVGTPVQIIITPKP